MTPDRQKVLADFVLEQWLPRPRRVRNWSLLGLAGCALVAGVLLSVWIDGAEGSDDIVVPAVIAGGLALAFGIGVAIAWFDIRDLRQHELIRALRQNPPGVEHVERLTIQGPYGTSPALSFKVRGGSAHVVAMSEPTCDEFVAWLGHR